MQTLKEYTVKSESFFNLISDPILWRQCQKFEAFQTFFCVCAYTHIHSHTHRHTYVHIYIYASFSVVYLFLQKCYCTRHTVLQFAFLLLLFLRSRRTKHLPWRAYSWSDMPWRNGSLSITFMYPKKRTGLRDHAGWGGFIQVWVVL